MSYSTASNAKKIEVFIRLSIPYMLLLFCVVLDVVSYGYLALQEVKPFLSFICVFYWCVYRPTLMPLWFVFFLGLFLDLIHGYDAVGLNALSFVLMRGFIAGQRKLFIGQPFIMLMLGFSIVSLSFFGFQWLVMGVLSAHMIAFMPLLIKAVSGILFFPVFYMLMHMVHKRLPGRA